MVAPFSFGLGGNAVTVSLRLFNEMQDEGAAAGDGPAAIAQAIARVVARRRAAGAPPLTIAMVFPFSGHNYELRYWLASAGLDPDRDVRLVVLPPPFMVDALAEGHVDAFCVGEPWNSIAVDRGVGAIVVTQVGAVAAGTGEGARAPRRLRRARPRAALRADPRPLPVGGLGWRSGQPRRRSPSCWRDRPMSAARRRRYGGRSRARSSPRRRRAAAPIPDFLVFHDHAANFPWQSHALWFYSQMVRWGQTDYSAERAEIARARLPAGPLSRRAEADRSRPAQCQLQGRRGARRGRRRLPRAWAGWCSGRTASSTGSRSIPTMYRAISRRLRSGG